MKEEKSKNLVWTSLYVRKFSSLYNLCHRLIKTNVEQSMMRTENVTIKFPNPIITHDCTYNQNRIPVSNSIWYQFNSHAKRKAVQKREHLVNHIVALTSASLFTYCSLFTLEKYIFLRNHGTILIYIPV